MAVNKTIVLSALCMMSLLQLAYAQQKSKPNLIIIHTDEHNLRTIGAYRETMSDEQAYMWGKEAIVTTPNIDKLAENGVICTNW